MKPKKDELLFLALGGSGEIGMNVNLYGTDGKWLMVDLGMTFSGQQYPGVDLVFADLEFIEERREDLVGIVLTHGHEDHIGAIPYFADELGVPLYATPFTARLIQEKLEEAGIVDEVELNVVDDLERFELGPFGVQYVPLAHSIAEGNALLIDTPHGRIFHTGDWKLDEEPVVGVPTSEEELRAIGADGVLALVCDSTNVFDTKASGSEGGVRRALDEEILRHKGKRVLVTTFASNVARMETLGEVARDTGRQLCVAGRSLDRIIRIAQASGYLKNFPETVDWDTAMGLPRGEVMIIATGGQGEPRAALSRIADGSHPISLEAGDVILFSSRQIPGNEIAIGAVMNKLAGDGIEMVTANQAAIHVSGHPGRPDLEALYEWIDPEIIVPVHGEMRHIVEHARLGKNRGIRHQVVQSNGDVVRLAPGKPGKIGVERSGRLILDGDIIAPADGESIVMRRRLAESGIVIVALDGKDARVSAIGLPLEEDMEDFLDEARNDVLAALRKLKGGKARDPEQRREAARLAARRAAKRWSGKKPQVEVLV